MQSRTAFAVLVVAICTTLALSSVPEVGEAGMGSLQLRHDADLDVACLDVTVPPQTIDFDSTFVPQIQVKNNRYTVNDVPVRFVIVRASDPTDTIYHDTAHTGPIGTYKTKLVDFTLECTPDPDLFTMVGITELPGDTAPHNDTCSKSLLVVFKDVATRVGSPRGHVNPGLLNVSVGLTNEGTVPALVERVDMTIRPCGYHDWAEYIVIGVGQNVSVSLNPAVRNGSGYETCTAWITYPEDMHHPNDTDVTVVEVGNPGLSGDVGIDLDLSPGLLAGSIARTGCSLSHTEPLNVTLFDIKGRRVAKYCLGAKEFSLDLRGLKSGVYFVRLDDGRSAVTQKLVVQRQE